MFSVVRRAVDDILECPICIETMSDTRVLPCIHTFCLKCIRKYGNDNKGQISCPCCRKSCRVPAGGFEDLPKNIQLEKLLEIQTTSDETSITQDLKYSNGEEGSVMTKDIGLSRLCQISCHTGGYGFPLANSYCTECNSYMCSDCWKVHTQKNGTGSHLVLQIGCSAHPERPLEFYCKTCKMPTCDACISSSRHRRHQCCSLSGHINSLQSELKLFKSQLSEKDALERENHTLKSQISHNETLKRDYKELKSKIVHLKKMEHENKIQLDSGKEQLKSRITKCERLAEILKAKDVHVEKLTDEIKSLKTRVAELLSVQHRNEKLQVSTRMEFHHLLSLESWGSKRNECRVHSYEEVMLLCRNCKKELCLNCFKLQTARELKDGARQFLLLIIVILIGALIYVLRS